MRRLGDRQYLVKEDWEKFEELFEKVEGTNWYDVRELALMLIKNSELERKLRENKENISTILTMALTERRAEK